MSVQPPLWLHSHKSMQSLLGTASDDQRDPIKLAQTSLLIQRPTPALLHCQQMHFTFAGSFSTCQSSDSLKIHVQVKKKKKRTVIRFLPRATGSQLLWGRRRIRPALQPLDGSSQHDGTSEFLIFPPAQLHFHSMRTLLPQYRAAFTSTRQVCLNENTAPFRLVRGVWQIYSH